MHTVYISANEILNLAIDEHQKRFNENADFNFYENNNGVVCRDCTALVDYLI